jgi:hypothetical protein
VAVLLLVVEVVGLLQEEVELHFEEEGHMCKKGGLPHVRRSKGVEIVRSQQ